MQRIKNIEILRIIGCVAIVMLHFFSHHLGSKYGNIPIYHHLKLMTSNGQKAVDLFFILSGCFFAITFNKNIDIWDFLKKKLIRLYPVLLFVIGGMFILSLFHFTKFDFYSCILCLFGLNGTILSLKIGYIEVFWYVSVMLWTLLLYFYLLKHYEQKNVNLFAFLTLFISYGVIIQAKNGHISGPLVTFGYLYQFSTLRGLGGISLGYLLGNWYKNNIELIKNYIPSWKQKIFLTSLEFVCLFFIINNLIFHKIKFDNDIIFILTFALIIFLFLLNKGYISKILDNDICSKFSKYTYSIYMTHSTIIKTLLINTIWKHTSIVTTHPNINIVIIFLSTIVFGILTYHLIEVPCLQYLLHKYSSNKNV